MNKNEGMERLEEFKKGKIEMVKKKLAIAEMEKIAEKFRDDGKITEEMYMDYVEWREANK